MDSVQIPPNYELRFDGQLLDVWFKGDRRVYRCDPRMERYRFTRARVFGGEYLDIYGQVEGDTWATRIKAEYVAEVKAFIERVFDGGSLDGDAGAAQRSGTVGDPIRAEINVSTGPAAFEQVKAKFEQMAAENPGSVVRFSTEGSSVGPSDDVDRLAKLADLHERGALTDEEFELEKAKILKES